MFKSLLPLLCIAAPLLCQQAQAQTQQSTGAASVTSQPATATDDAPANPMPASQDFPDHIVGDIGLGVFHSERNVLGKKDTTALRPYLYFDYDRFFARLDTFGIKTVKLGNGYLELSGRAAFNIIHSENGLKRRSGAIPLGIGTYQETSVGGFFLNAFYDINQSRGSILEAMYALEFSLGKAVFYPQIGIERHSANYNNYFYGVSANEAAHSPYHAYQAGASNDPVLALSMEYPLSQNWVANLTYRRQWYSSAVSSSPIIHRHFSNLGFVAISYRFK